MGETVGSIAAGSEPPPAKLDRFIEAFVRMTEVRPWMPAIMLREIAEGAPRLDGANIQHMRSVIGGFSLIVEQGVQSGVFRRIHPLLAYESVVGPIIINAARERVAALPERQHQDFPLLVEISHADLVTHSQEAARRMFATDTSHTRATKGTDQ
jgi:hypothetical protein